ncbi:MAG: hypothetical protein IIU66_02360, partial [Clostridia bacterium]|nr:hypothetical protein [Clostridia bacterium]
EKESTCSKCGTKTKETIDMIEHTYGEAVVTKEATELEEGLKTQTCTVCGDVKEDAIPVLSTNVEISSDIAEEDVNDAAGNNNMLWIIIAVGAIAVIAVGATIVVIKKKKA